MKIPSLLKDWRVLLFLAVLIVSIALIIPVQKQGVLVKSVNTDSPFYGKVAPSEYITWAGSKIIKSPEDFQAFENYTGTLFFQHSGKSGLDSAVLTGSGMGIDVVKPSSTRLNLGMDLIGGTRVLLKVKENVSDAVVEQSIATLQTRINIYGLREAKFQSVKQDSANFIQIEMSGGSKQEIDNLLAKQGKFEAYIPKIVNLEIQESKEGSNAEISANASPQAAQNYSIISGNVSNSSTQANATGNITENNSLSESAANTSNIGNNISAPEKQNIPTKASGLLSVNGTNYTVSIDMENKTSEVQGIGIVRINDSFVLNNISFTFMNYTDSTAIFRSVVFSSADIKSVCMQSIQGICSSVIQQREDGFEFSFQVTISKEGAERFAALTKDMRIEPELVEGKPTGRYILKEGGYPAVIQLYLDKKPITELSIDKGLKGKVVTSPAVTGFKTSQAEAIKEKLFLQSILQSGVLPVSLNVERVDQISASLGSEFIRSIMIAGIVAAIAVIVVVFIRYRNLRITLPMVFTSLSEVIIILGAASLIGWTIDIAAIAGIIAVIGTGVDAQIFIIDELITGRDRVFTFKEKIKRAFFMIFSSAATVVAAMLPLLFIGIGVMRGFAITTLLGVFIGVFIARPAFSKIAEKILEKQMTAKHSEKI